MVFVNKKRKGNTMFVVKYLLKIKHNEDLYLNKCFDCEQKVANVIVKHCVKLLNKLKYDTDYQDLLTQRKNVSIKENKDKKLISQLNKELSDYRNEIGLSLYALEKYAKVQQKKYKKYLSSQEVQVIVANVWKGVEKILFEDGNYLHFKKKGSYDCLSAKSLTNGIKVNLYNQTIIVGNLDIPFLVKDYDAYAKFALNECKKTNNDNNIKLKYARMKRLHFNNGYRYYVEFVFAGIPFLKHQKGCGDCGIDVGVSSIASVSDDVCLLEDLAPNIEKYNQKIIKLQKQLERSKRVNNPTCYKEDGTIIKGSRFVKTKNYFRVLRKLKTLYRKRKAYVEENHSKLANTIIEHCDTIYIEPMHFKALQKRAKTLKRQEKLSTITNKNGNTKEIHKFKRKKRYGKTLNNKSPSAFVTTLKQKCDFYGMEMKEINTNSFKASQYNHITNDYTKKELKQRWNTFHMDNETFLIQRDLYSAFLIKNSNVTLTQPNQEKCKQEFQHFKELHNQCIAKVKATNHNRLSCFGF